MDNHSKISYFSLYIKPIIVNQIALWIAYQSVTEGTMNEYY